MMTDFPDCKKHPDYDPHRAPRKDCQGCWCLYNWEHDLPLGNRTSRSSFKPTEHDLRLSRHLPRMKGVQTLDGVDDCNRFHTPEFADHLVEDLGLKTVCVGVDLSLSSTGIAVILREEDTWYVGTTTVGMSLSDDASTSARVSRLISITETVISAHRSYSYNDCGGVSQSSFPPMFIEDHAYSMSGNRASDTIELHGVLKSQVFLSRGIVPDPIPISTARKEAFCQGRIQGQVKKKIKRALSDSEHTWHQGLTDDEIDAWAVCTPYIKSNAPVSLQYDLTRRGAFDRYQSHLTWNENDEG